MERTAPTNRPDARKTRISGGPSPVCRMDSDVDPEPVLEPVSGMDDMGARMRTGCCVLPVGGYKDVASVSTPRPRVLQGDKSEEVASYRLRRAKAALD